MIILLIMWFGGSVPLIMTGSFFGFRKEAYSYPVSINQIPRQIPTQPWFLNGPVAVMLAGILPFGAIFIELFFILNAIWENQFYYMFGFLFLVFMVLIISCSEITIVMAYMQLCAEDYHWWWRSFFVSGGCAFYVWLYVSPSTQPTHLSTMPSPSCALALILARVLGRALEQATLNHVCLRLASHAPTISHAPISPAQVCDVLLFHKARGDGHCEHYYLRRVHHAHVARLFLPHRNHRILFHVLLRHKDLRCG
jgi:hypothetical protein